MDMRAIALPVHNNVGMLLHGLAVCPISIMEKRNEGDAISHDPETAWTRFPKFTFAPNGTPEGEYVEAVAPVRRLH
jgi:hypothetical protein